MTSSITVESLELGTFLKAALEGKIDRKRGGGRQGAATWIKIRKKLVSHCIRRSRTAHERDKS